MLGRTYFATDNVQSMLRCNNNNIEGTGKLTS
jgi:hypothetical protein